MTGKAAVCCLEVLGQHSSSNIICATNKLSKNEGICEWCPNTIPGHNKSARISTTNNKVSGVLAKNSASYSVAQTIPVAVRCKE